LSRLPTAVLDAENNKKSKAGDEAGIAHEIKSPLNFVNNFASLSVELLGEPKETTSPALGYARRGRTSRRRRHNGFAD